MLPTKAITPGINGISFCKIVVIKENALRDLFITVSRLFRSFLTLVGIGLAVGGFAIGADR